MDKFDEYDQGDRKPMKKPMKKGGKCGGDCGCSACKTLAKIKGRMTASKLRKAK